MTPFESAIPRTRMPARRVNVVGIVGLCMVSMAAILSPTGFFGITLCLLVPLGFGGLIVCVVGASCRPRWPAVVGLCVGLTCVALWIAVFMWGAYSFTAPARRTGVGVRAYMKMSMDASGLAAAAEARRRPDGSPPRYLSIMSVDLSTIRDPWGRPYRYCLTNTARMYTFTSDGPDGVTNTPDDIDVFTMNDGTRLETPPISQPPLPAPVFRLPIPPGLWR